MDTTIRRLRDPSELRICCDIWLAASERGHDFVAADFWRTKYDDMLATYLPSASIHLACDGGTAVGFSATSGDSLEALFVRPDMWGQGVGKALLAFLLSRHDRLRLAVYAKNERAVTFYKRSGFVQTGAAVCPYTGENELYMEWIPV